MPLKDFQTADLCDQLGLAAQVAQPGFSSFGAVPRFAGPVRTVKCLNDNSKVRATLETPGDGAVLVVDGGASMDCALLGDKLATLAIENGWAGIVVNGCIRDSAVIDGMPIGVKALATHPRKSEKRGEGEVDVPLELAGVTLRPGDMLYADADGWIVTATQ